MLTLSAAEIIRRKRDGHALNNEEIAHFVNGLVTGEWAEGQVGAMAMAVLLNGMGTDETVALTQAMMRSGQVIDWREVGLPGPILDKHSSGGVGDKVSLILAPLVAACGGYVPMISGRGLGHTGGTLDKFDSIPGYQTQPSLAKFKQTVAAAGCAVIGQTSDLAPADKRLYAVRDVTATVESVPLITASILSKKLAAGLGGLSMDIKCGNGAFAGDLAFAKKLSESILSVATGAGLPTRVWITDMNQVLGHSAGNGLEMRESLEMLTGVRKDPRLWDVTQALAADMLVLGGLATDLPEAKERIQAALDSGNGAERFGQMVSGLGGPHDFVERFDAYLEKAPVVLPVFATESGWVQGHDTRNLGLVIIELGGGRRRADEAINHTVGLNNVVPVGSAVDAGQPIAWVHAKDDASAQHAAALVARHIHLSKHEVTGTAPLLQHLNVEDLGVKV